MLVILKYIVQDVMVELGQTNFIFILFCSESVQWSLLVIQQSSWIFAPRK